MGRIVGESGGYGSYTPNADWRVTAGKAENLGDGIYFTRGSEIFPTGEILRNEKVIGSEGKDVGGFTPGFLLVAKKVGPFLGKEFEHYPLGGLSLSGGIDGHHVSASVSATFARREDESVGEGTGRGVGVEWTFELNHSGFTLVVKGWKSGGDRRSGLSGFEGLLQNCGDGGGFDGVDFETCGHHLVAEVEVGDHLFVQGIHGGGVVLGGTDGDRVESGDELSGELSHCFEVGGLDSGLHGLGIGGGHGGISVIGVNALE